MWWEGFPVTRKLIQNGRESAQNLSMRWCKKDLPEWNNNEVTQCISTMAAKGVS